MKKMLVSYAVALAMLLSGSISVYADTIPWGYTATSPADISASTSPLSSISFAGATGVASGDSGIIIYNLKTNSSATDAAPDSFSNVPFNLSISLTDIKATGSVSPSAIPTGAVNFSGLFNATNVTAKSLLPGMPGWTLVPGNASPMQASVTLGSDDTGWRTYNVTISSFTSPGQPGGAPGSIQAIVNIVDGQGHGSGDPPPPSNTPEPASLVLAGLGLPLVVLLRRRMKKAQA
jgi:PEP-CTERM motif